MVFCFLALYTWNARTGYLDSLAENSGLEVTGYLLRPGTWAMEHIQDYWQRYFALVDVAEENVRLRDEIRRAEEYLAQVREEHAELRRLRALVGIQPPEGWSRLGARVLSGRFGPGAALESVMIDRGYATGAAPGTPVVTHLGLAGRVFRASPRAATVTLLTDHSFRAAVVTQEGRVPGILAGNGAHLPLELRYMDLNTHMSVGDMLVTSGLDGEFPKGIPVARITRVSSVSESLFQIIEAEPVVPLDELEEVAVLTAMVRRFATQPMLLPGVSGAPGADDPAVLPSDTPPGQAGGQPDGQSDGQVVTSPAARPRPQAAPR